MRNAPIVTTIKPWGNSAAVRLPVRLLNEAGLDLDHAVELRVERHGLSLRPQPRPRTTTVLQERSMELEQLQFWALSAKQHGDCPIVVTMGPETTQVMLEPSPARPQVLLMEMPRIVSDRVLSMAYHVLSSSVQSAGASCVLDLDRAQQALIVVPPDGLLENPVNWVWRSHPTPEGAIVTLRPATPAQGYRVGQGDRAGTLGEVREMLDRERWAALGETPSNHADSLVSLLGILGRAADPLQARQALLELAARALVTVEGLDAQPAE